MAELTVKLVSQALLHLLHGQNVHTALKLCFSNRKFLSNQIHQLRYACGRYHDVYIGVPRNKIVVWPRVAQQCAVVNEVVELVSGSQLREAFEHFWQRW